MSWQEFDQWVKHQVEQLNEPPPPTLWTRIESDLAISRTWERIRQRLLWRRRFFQWLRLQIILLTGCTLWLVIPHQISENTHLHLRLHRQSIPSHINRPGSQPVNIFNREDIPNNLTPRHYAQTTTTITHNPAQNPIASTSAHKRTTPPGIYLSSSSPLSGAQQPSQPNTSTATAPNSTDWIPALPTIAQTPIPHLQTESPNPRPLPVKASISLPYFSSLNTRKASSRTYWAIDGGIATLMLMNQEMYRALFTPALVRWIAQGGYRFGIAHWRQPQPHILWEGFLAFSHVREQLWLYVEGLWRRRQINATFLWGGVRLWWKHRQPAFQHVVLLGGGIRAGACLQGKLIIEDARQGTQVITGALMPGIIAGELSLMHLWQVPSLPFHIVSRFSGVAGITPLFRRISNVHGGIPLWFEWSVGIVLPNHRTNTPH